MKLCDECLIRCCGVCGQRRATPPQETRGSPPRFDGCAGVTLFGLVMATLIIAGVLLLLV
jgi:hypothetical protein